MPCGMIDSCSRRTPSISSRSRSASLRDSSACAASMADSRLDNTRKTKSPGGVADEIEPQPGREKPRQVQHLGRPAAEDDRQTGALLLDTQEDVVTLGGCHGKGRRKQDNVPPVLRQLREQVFRRGADMPLVLPGGEVEAEQVCL